MCKDVTGQRGEFLSHRMEIVLISDCKVLDHSIKRVAPSVVKRMSPLASCLIESNDPTVCGSTLDSLRKEKYATSNKSFVY